MGYLIKILLILLFFATQSLDRPILDKAALFGIARFSLGVFFGIINGILNGGSFLVLIVSSLVFFAISYGMLFLMSRFEGPVWYTTAIVGSGMLLFIF